MAYILIDIGRIVFVYISRAQPIALFERWHLIMANDEKVEIVIHPMFDAIFVLAERISQLSDHNSLNYNLAQSIIELIDFSDMSD
jgi:hypothetical protein